MCPIWPVVSSLQPPADGIILMIPHVVGGGPGFPGDAGVRASRGVPIPGLLPQLGTQQRELSLC